MAASLAARLLLVSLAGSIILVAGCRVPPVPQYAFLASPCESTAPGAVCTIACRSGYSLQGEGVRVCSNSGQWVGLTTHDPRVSCAGKQGE